MAYGNINFLQSPKKGHLIVVVVLSLWAAVICGSLFYSGAAKKELPQSLAPVFSDSGPEEEQAKPQEVDCSQHPYVVGPKPSFDVARKIAYVSRHVGTTADFKYMADNLQLENVEYFDCTSWYEFKDSREKYMTIIDNGKLDQICSEYDAIFVSDLLADGWAFIVGEKPKCKNVFFVVTNRFDVGVQEHERKQWYDDVNRALNRKDDYRIRLVVNNLFELPFMENRGVSIPSKETIPIIRPFGSTTIPAKKEKVKEEPCLLIARVEQDRVLMHQLVKDNTGYDCKVLDGHYGGPKTLNRYNSIVVHLPYQVSIMKMWENLNYGILMAIPSPSFFTKICDENDCKQKADVFETKNVFDEKTWQNFVDFYLPGWEECFLQFDNWGQLQEIIEKRSFEKDINICRDKMLDMRDSNLQQWKTVLKSII